MYSSGEEVQRPHDHVPGSHPVRTRCGAHAQLTGRYLAAGVRCICQDTPRGGVCVCAKVMEVSQSPRQPPNICTGTGLLFQALEVMIQRHKKVLLPYFTAFLLLRILPCSNQATNSSKGRSPASHLLRSFRASSDQFKNSVCVIFLARVRELNRL